MNNRRGNHQFYDTGIIKQIVKRLDDLERTQTETLNICKKVLKLLKNKEDCNLDRYKVSHASI